MSGLNPGPILPSAMNQRQFDTWCRSQSIEGIAADAVAAHVALADPHTQYALDTDITALNLVSGTYTPTLTNVGNVSTTTAFACQYMRVKNTVTVSGVVGLTPIGAGATQLGISLPIASALTSFEQLAGTACANATSFAAILGDATNDRAELQYVSAGAAVQFYFSFTYRVI
jgi:hypothetical protein